MTPSTSRAPRRRARHGFTLLELMVVTVVVALLVSIALPTFRRAIMKARAAQAVGDLQVLRVAVFNYLGDKHHWPPDARVGDIPSGLGPYLPEGYSMTREHYDLNYDNWASQSVKFIAVTVEVEDLEFGYEVVDMLGPNAWTNDDFKFTWVLEWLE